MNSKEDVWNAVLSLLSKSISAVAIDTWFRECKVSTVTESCLYIDAPSEFIESVIVKRFSQNLADALHELFGEDYRFVISYDVEPEPIDPKVTPDEDGHTYSFKNFVVGPSNRFAYAAAMAVAEEQTKNYNPLFIYGDSGLGKTHLLYAIKNELRRRHPTYSIALARGADFMNELVSAIQTGKNMEFREKYRKADVLLIDDIQIIAGKASTEEEVFQTFNTLHEAGKQIVFTSDRPPSEMTLLADRLKTRFESGLLADIQAPDFETRMAIVKNKGNQLGVAIPDDVARFIAEKMTSNVRQLEGAVKKIKAQQELDPNLDLSLSSIDDVLGPLFKGKGAYVPTSDDIIEETAKYFSVPVSELKGKSRTKNVTLARQVAMYLLRTLTSRTQQEIGEIFDRDHTTVISSLNKVVALLSQSPDFNRTLKDITANINSRGV